MFYTKKKQGLKGQGAERNCPEKFIVRVGFWQNGFFADFYFWPAGFCRGFSHRIFSPHFCGTKWPEKSSRKIPGKILQKLHNRNPRHISAEGPGQVLNSAIGGHLKPVTLKPVSRISRFLVSAFSASSAFSAFSLRGISPETKPGLKGEWVIRIAHLVFHRVFCYT